LAFVDIIRERASRNPKRIALSESEDARTIEAVDTILEKRIARVILIGKDDIAGKIRAKNRRDLELIDPEKYRETESFISEYYELRRHKGVTPEEARTTVLGEYVTFAAMLTRRGIADGFVAGASHTTPDVIRAALRCLPKDPAIGVISGAFVMEVPRCHYGENGVFIFSDCGVNPDPNPDQLAGNAISSATLFEQLTGGKARVALLSYSSKESAQGPLVEKIREALKKAQAAAPGLLIDGEFQADSAIVPEVAELKCPGSDVAGRANVLIFPNLDSGNIAYKLVQRLANARAIGPFLLGFKRPCSDLSRGCSADDIVDAAAVTALRA
jgi:phosphate acetyltransferase